MAEAKRHISRSRKNVTGIESTKGTKHSVASGTHTAKPINIRIDTSQVKKANAKTASIFTDFIKNPEGAHVSAFFQHNPAVPYFATKKSAIDLLKKAGVVTTGGKIAHIYKSSK